MGAGERTREEISNNLNYMNSNLSKTVPSPNPSQLIEVGSPVPAIKKARKNKKQADCLKLDGILSISQAPVYSPYLVIVPTNGKLNTMSVFGISKALKESGVCSQKSVNRLGNGSILVQVSSPFEAENLKKITAFGGTPVTVEPHRSLNRSRGVIRDRELIGCTEEEMVENIDGVVEAKRITIRRDGNSIPTNSFILTFDSPKPPTRIQVAYLNLEVRPYVPNPMRCFGCQRYGHTKVNCQRQTVCARCGKADHSEENCSADPKCVNCNGQHAAHSKECVKWQEEKAILKYRATHGGTFKDAKKAVLVPIKSSLLSVSYADAARADPKPTEVKPAVIKNNQKTMQKTAKVERKRKSKNIFSLLEDEAIPSPLTPLIPLSQSPPPTSRGSETQMECSSPGECSSPKTPPKIRPLISPTKGNQGPKQTNKKGSPSKIKGRPNVNTVNNVHSVHSSQKKSPPRREGSPSKGRSGSSALPSTSKGRVDDSTRPIKVNGMKPGVRPSFSKND